MSTEQDILILKTALQSITGLLKEFTERLLTEPDKTSSLHLLNLIEQSLEQIT